jgi:hypothetical protein
MVDLLRDRDTDTCRYAMMISFVFALARALSLCVYGCVWLHIR